MYNTILVCASLFRDKEQIAVSNRTVKYLLSLFLSLSLSAKDDKQYHSFQSTLKSSKFIDIAHHLYLAVT